VDYNQIEIRRKKLKLTQQELAKKANISRVGYQKIIKKQSSTVETLELISKALGVDMSFWWNDETSEDNEIELSYGKAASDIIQDLLDDKKRLKARIDELENKIGANQIKEK
jgi:transcriptional regulator with XRE-family HTH domain